MSTALTGSTLIKTAMEVFGVLVTHGLGVAAIFAAILENCAPLFPPLLGFLHWDDIKRNVKLCCVDFRRRKPGL